MIPVLLDFLQYPARISDGNDACGDVAGHDAARPDDAPFADGNARADGDVACNPAVIPDGDGLRVFVVCKCSVGLLEYVAFLPAERMQGSVDGDIRAEKDVLADGDRCAVENGEVEVCVGVFADLRIHAVVEENWALQVHARLALYKQFVQDAFALVVRLVEVVVLAAQGMRGLAQSYEFSVGGVVRLAREHLLFFGHALTLNG